ncbi:MAG: amidohydrolase family protein [Acidimicrobiia bacterium]
MHVIAIEEHFITPEGFALSDERVSVPTQRWEEQLASLGERRLADMDAAGIDVQVLSTPPIGVEELDPVDAIPMAKQVNDVLASAIAEHPERFAGFAVLPMLDATAAADELERTVREFGFKGALINGHTRGRFLDDQDFWPVFERAEALEVPIYLHPTRPPQKVVEAYYSDLPGMVGNALALAGWGWHCETGLHMLRMVVGGVFDRFPSLSVIIGHMGENVPFSLARADEILTPYANLQKRVGDYFHENIYITTSGYFTFAPLLCALMVLGADRILFATDYPYSDMAEGRAFLDAAPINPTDREKIAHGNAERLLRM